MADLASISLYNVKTFGNWKTAPVGTILQARTTADNAALIGLRCEMKIGGLPYPCFLVLDGEHRGELLEAGAIGDSVLDVTSLVEIRVGDLSPVPYAPAHYKFIGFVCEYQAGSGHFFVKAKMMNGKYVFVWLAGPSKNEPMGTIADDPPPVADLLIIGFPQVVEKRSGSENSN